MYTIHSTQQSPSLDFSSLKKFPTFRKTEISLHSANYPHSESQERSPHPLLVPILSHKNTVHTFNLSLLLVTKIQSTLLTCPYSESRKDNPHSLLVSILRHKNTVHLQFVPIVTHENTVHTLNLSLF